MFTVYILRSKTNNKRCVGCTGKDVERRLHEHNSGGSAFTRRNGSFVLVYKEMYSTKKEALIREKFLKSGQGRKQLDNMDA